MMSKQIIRTLMVETPSIPGNLGKVATAIGLAGGDIGEIQTVKVGPNYTIRNITVQVDHEEQIEELADTLSRLDGIRLHAVSDEVLHAHEGGNIHMKSKVDLKT